MRKYSRTSEKNRQISAFGNQVYWLHIGLCVIFLIGCQTNSPLDTSARDQVTEALNEAERQIEKQSQQQKKERKKQKALDELKKSVTREMNHQISSGLKQTFDISVSEMPAREFFMSLVTDTEFNILLHNDIEGEISISLKNVTLAQVLEAVEAVYGYHVEQNSYGYHIYPFELRTQVYNLNYLNVKRKGKSATSVNSGEISSQGSSNSGSGGSSLSKSTQIETETETDFWDELSEVLSIMLGNAEGRSVVINAQSGVVVVKASPSEHKTIMNFLAAAEKNLKRQVVIEAKILEVELNDSYQSGINWAILTSSGAQNDKSVAAGVVTDTLLSSSTLDAPTIAEVGNQLVSENEVQGIFSAAFNLNDFTGLLELLRTQGEVHVLSSPRISTVNNQKAVIKVGTDEFFVTEFTNNTTTAGDDVVTSPEFTLTPFFSGIALDVTPQISDSDEVILHIHPSVTEVTDQTKVINVLQDSISLPLALSTIRESDSIVKAKSNQIIVIGGLLQTQTRDIDSQTPFLGDIPIIGKLFHQKRQSSRKSELVILLKPVIADAPDWLDILPGNDGHLSKTGGKKASNVTVFR